jgi:hypothetical protein
LGRRVRPLRHPGQCKKSLVDTDCIAIEGEETIIGGLEQEGNIINKKQNKPAGDFIRSSSPRRIKPRRPPRSHLLSYALHPDRFESAHLRDRPHYVVAQYEENCLV